MKRWILALSFPVSLLVILLFLIIVKPFEQQNTSEAANSDVLADEGTVEQQQAEETNSSEESTAEEQQGEETVEVQPPKPVTAHNLIAYDGIVEHIFFHPLIVYPELAFDGDYMEQGYNDYFTTIPEFERLLEELYRRNFILVHLSDVFETDPADPNNVVKRTMMLPEGKKPLVISIDDLNYYEYMIEHGNAYKLILDENGKIATYSKNSQGKDVISYSDEIVTLLDAFVEKHPDFSHEGAKGTIALTGYEGVLGYRTQKGSPNRESEIAEAKKVIAQLKKTGWIFASHSYGHINVTKATLQQLIADSEAWKEEVESLVGPTPLYIYPYGARAEYGDKKFNYLVANGFKVISAVGPTSYTLVTNGAYTMDRRHMDGIGFIKQPHTMTDLMDVNYVLDRENRPAKYWE